MALRPVMNVSTSGIVSNWTSSWAGSPAWHSRGHEDSFSHILVNKPHDLTRLQIVIGPGAGGPPQSAQPFLANDYLTTRGMTSFAAGDYAEAIRTGRCLVQDRPNYIGAYRIMTASYALLDRMDEARSSLKEGAPHPFRRYSLGGGARLTILGPGCQTALHRSTAEGGPSGLVDGGYHRLQTPMRADRARSAASASPGVASGAARPPPLNNTTVDRSTPSTWHR